MLNIEYPPSVQEGYHMVEKVKQSSFQSEKKLMECSDLHEQIKRIQSFIRPRENNVYSIKQIVSLICRWKLNSLKTKYVEHVSCICGNRITIDHILTCQLMQGHMPLLSSSTISAILGDPLLTYDFFKSLLRSPIGSLL